MMLELNKENLSTCAVMPRAATELPLRLSRPLSPVVITCDNDADRYLCRSRYCRFQRHNNPDVWATLIYHIRNEALNQFQMIRVRGSAGWSGVMHWSQNLPARKLRSASTRPNKLMTIVSRVFTLGITLRIASSIVLCVIRGPAILMLTEAVENTI